MSIKQPKIVVVVGETASGKSELALRLAKQYGGEVICADSWTVRRGVDIGTAKPTTAERETVAHHLVDIVEPCQDFTAAVFKRLANQAIKDINNRGKLPIMVGGTGLYIDGVLYDYSFLPAGDTQLRTELNQLSVNELLKRISSLSIELGEVDIRNKRRLIRLIENNGRMPSRNQLRKNTLIIGIQLDRNVLNERIMERVDDMVTAGLEAEVRGLADRYGWDCEALKGIGYAQWRGYIEGRQSLDETRLQIIRATNDLAKRQRTWFQRNKSIHWLSTPVNWLKVVDLVTSSLES